MAPKGHWAVRFEAQSKTAKMFYTNSGEHVKLGSELDGVNLNQDIFPQLAMYGAGASLGQTNLDVAIDSKYFELTTGYGITDKLTIGAIIPYRDIRKSINFSVGGGNLGLNPLFNSTEPASVTNLPYLPIENGITPITTAQMQEILASKYGYKPLETRNISGFADPTIGLLWNAYSTDDSSLMLSSGYRFGIQEGDPDRLIDTTISSGSSTIRLQAEYLKELAYGFDLYSRFEYGIELEGRVTKRVPEQGKMLAPKSSKESLTRDLGDYRIYDIGLGKTWGNWRTALNWYRAEKDSDNYSSSKGTDTTALETHTSGHVNQWKTSLSWSGIESWKRGNLALPLVVNLVYRDTYDGKNTPDYQDVYLQLTSFW
ncbi:hypothetical protein GSY74_03275 [Sulfurovum sp. bin170]|uniref:hypothetical protein n=1 Tax=Sulfurovum sp. bin170 TaxID=2695268 RepID=UPI0013E001BE|nr:hypothetical protein [Sulfurovum sp. bin170]NEW60294.1 hypothetical protein [Sulfurovum sp. bin170]